MISSMHTPLIVFKGFFLTLILLCLGCNENRDKNTTLLFEDISSEYSNVNFANQISESEDFHYYKYIYAYNGGGVALADFNADGLVDIFFISNLLENKLYRNKGDFKFEDVTGQANFKKNNGFNSGVSVADVNNDGLPDLYICRAGKYDDERLINHLYINKGDFIFSEQASSYGVDDANRSTSASFFDYNKDGFLDLFVVNTPNISNRSQEILDLKSLQDNPATIALKGYDKLYKNNGNNTFSEVTTEAGIAMDEAFGLNAQIGDLNNDNWPDIYVNNDFDMPDFVYVNNKNGTFTESRNELFKHLSFYSMGSDIADVNNDGMMDLLTLDMSPEDHVRSKTTMAMTSLGKFQKMVDNNYHHQYMHNMLHINNGNSSFSEISQMAGVANTDWSWSALMADFDLDGYNDIYITNGIFRDVIDQDISNEIKESIREKGRRPTNSELLIYTQMLPQQKLANYIFKNNGEGAFENKSNEWTTGEPTFSNGAAYADLDLDGDLDLVVNNINEEASILKNKAIENIKGNYIQFEFIGPDENKFGVGVKVELFLENKTTLVRELVNSRGYLSSVSNVLHFGLGSIDLIPRLKITWPNGRIEELTDIHVNQKIKVSHKNSFEKVENDPLIPELFGAEEMEIAHIDMPYNDYNKQLLLPHKLSQTGPAVAVGDINNDGYDDVFIGGARGYEGKLLIGMAGGDFKTSELRPFAADIESEDVSAVLFDLEGDGDLDLYVVSGSYEFDADSPHLQDRLYLNNGEGGFVKTNDNLPDFKSAGSIVTPGDFDEDGDLDLFVGSRVIPGLYPYAPVNYILKNTNGKFTIETQAIAPELEKIGMVTDAIWEDIDDDNDLDLIVTGEWMGIEVFENNSGRLNRSKKYAGLSQVKGWWNKLLIADMDNDGDKDIVAGNLGLNYKFHATNEKPFHVYTSDFDLNGVADIMLAKYYNNRQVLVRGKSCTAQQIPAINEITPTYADFASRDIHEIVGSNLGQALHLTVTEFRSGIFINEASNFSFEPFGAEVQKSLVNSILLEDLNQDGHDDLILAGNNYQSEIETTRADAGIGVCLKGDGKGTFEFIDNKRTGFFADKDVRHLVKIKTKEGIKIMVINNNSKHDLFGLQS